MTEFDVKVTTEPPSGGVFLGEIKVDGDGNPYAVLYVSLPGRPNQFKPVNLYPGMGAKQVASEAPASGVVTTGPPVERTRKHLSLILGGRS